MNNFSRRQFLKHLGAVAGLFLASRRSLSLPIFSNDSRPFEMLVVGDSHISGQGLQEKNKFYYLVKEWLQKEVFGATRKVNLKVKAHSGSRISLHADELEKMLEAEDDINKFHHQEINLSFPSIGAQIDVARKEYEKPESVNLIVLSGGITDVLVANTVNPFLDEKKMRELIHKYCNEAMCGLLEHATDAFPNAVVAVVGYFPIISTKSDVNQLSKYLFKAVKFPHPLQFTFTNGFSKQFMKILRKNMARRSRIWVAESNRELREAIAKVNAKFDKPKVIFVETPITEENCYATKNSLLWQTDKDNFPNDELYNDRRIECREALDEIKFHHYGKLSLRLCELAAIGHPNIEGSKAYAEAIKKSLKPIYSVLPQNETL
ncbi:hypothetical protein BH18ACI1_BH18ACI1_07550 [soil metagenome]